MDANELMSSINKLRRLIVQVKNCQEDCHGDHECHWLENLNEAENIARDIEIEMELRQGEQIASAIKQCPQDGARKISLTTKQKEKPR